jgi:hypothetical protein
MAPKQNPVDPLEGPKLALKGRIVCMDDKFTVIPRGVLYVDQGSIVAAQEIGHAPPGFESTPVTDVGGTMFPGLIELHNHLSYNALRLWNVPKKYTNRNQWAGIPEYRKLIMTPMKIIGPDPQYVACLVRYVECKCLLGGVTTSQGIKLSSNAGISKYYRGIVRNVEQTGEEELHRAASRIPDVAAKDVQAFFKNLQKQTCYLLHLSEGTDKAANDHFQALHMPDGDWAIRRQLAGIHSTGLEEEDFDVMAAKKGAMVWSPLSNLLLYGETAKIKKARQAGLRIGIGSDWSPSGSKNLLGELKVARMYSAENGGIFNDRELLSMATRNAVSILGWEKALGSLEPGKRADVLVIDGTKKDPYSTLFEAKETDVRLVLINGTARFGTSLLMKALGADGESFQVGGRRRILHLTQKTQDPSVAAVPLGQARDVLSDVLNRLPELAKEKDNAPPKPKIARALRPEEITWSLALDELEDTGEDLRHHLPLPGTAVATAERAVIEAKPLAADAVALELDPLAIADDAKFMATIAGEMNLPAFVKEELKKMY